MKTLAWMALVAAAAGGWFAYVARAPSHADAGAPITKQALGALIFADTNLSEPAGQSCATCHDPAHAFADPRGTSTSEGAVKGRFGPRNAPSIVYASLTPKLTATGDEGYAGGQFWDGRANTIAEQVRGPLMNPLEMNNSDATMILRKLRASRYAPELLKLYGAHALDDADSALAHAADAISVYEDALPNRFTSKYDRHLAGNAVLTEAESRGLRLFESKKTGPCTVNKYGEMSPPCGCAQCHLDRPQEDGAAPLFTDFGYDNIGIPHNPEGPDGVDEGLGAITKNPQRRGQFKAPSLRNVAATAPYGHNGYFKTLKEVIDFYSARDFYSAWAHAEEPRGMNRGATGNLRLTDGEENDLVAFLETLTDGYTPAPDALAAGIVLQKESHLAAER